MFGKQFHLNSETLPVIEEIGEHMPGGFFIYKAGEPGELLFANHAVTDIFGCTDLEDFKNLTGYTFRGMVHPDDYEKTLTLIGEQIEQSEDHMDYCEYRIIQKREKIVSKIVSQQAEFDALSESFQKIHAENLTFSRVAQALATDYFSIYIVDPDTNRFVEYSANDAYDELGMEKSGEDFFSLSRRNMERLIYPEDKERFMAVFVKERILSILERDGSFTTKYRLMFGDDPVYVSMKATLLEDEHGRHLIIGTNNIDAQMKREQEYQKKVADARNRAKNDFLANMSHDIRTPMNAIVGYTNIANSHADNPVVIRDCLEKIGSSSHFLLSLINDILDISKIESGKMQLSIGECDLEAIFRRIKDITGLQAKNKGLRISYDHSTVKHYQVLSDELRLEQVLVNIVSNAIKYTPDGSTIRIRTQKWAGSACVSVADNGPGVPDSDKARVFDMFYTGSQNISDSRRSLGFGLALCKTIIQAHGGEISVSDNVPHGAIFTFCLPAEEVSLNG